MDKNPFFNYRNQKSVMVNYEIGGDLKPINAPSPNLRPVAIIPFDYNKKVIDLTPDYIPKFYSISPEYLKYASEKTEYAKRGLFLPKKSKLII